MKFNVIFNAALFCVTKMQFDVFIALLFCVTQMEFDVFNALDLMMNKEFLEKLKFGIGDGNLQYYLYNWRCASMEPNQVFCLLNTFTIYSKSETDNFENI